MCRLTRYLLDHIKIYFPRSKNVQLVLLVFLSRPSSTSRSNVCWVIRRVYLLLPSTYIDIHEIYPGGR